MSTPLDALPKGLQTLVMRGDWYFQYNMRLDLLPKGLRKLEIIGGFNHPFAPNTFPDSLKELALLGTYNQPILPGVLPRGLETLTLDFRYPHEHPVGVRIVTVDSRTTSR